MSGSAGTLKLTFLGTALHGVCGGAYQLGGERLRLMAGLAHVRDEMRAQVAFPLGADVHHDSPPMNAGCIHVPSICSESMNLAASHSGHETFV